MTRLLLIGNSHLAAFRKGWDMMAKAHPEVTVDFFAQPGPEYDQQRIDPEARATYNTQLESFVGRKMQDLTDYHHMNGSYGALCLSSAFPDILPQQNAA